MTFMTPTTAVNKVVTVPAPVGGLNARDSLANMPETDAITLNNWWPVPYGCRVRPGSLAWSLSVPGATGTLAVWSGVLGEAKLFTFGIVEGASDVGIYDITTRETTTSSAPAPVYTGLGSTSPSTLQIVNDGGAHLFFVSGSGPVVVYNSTGFHDITMASGTPPEPPADYTWYGGPGTATAQMASHQGHIWATDCKSSIGWYLPVDAIWGEWKPFDFGPQMTLGGALHSITTWTIDDGNGAEDHLVVITAQGQAIVYGGTDPNSIDTWSLVGVYTIGEPVGEPGRNITKVGGDLIVLTQRGLVSMAGQLVSTKVNGGVNAVNSAKVQLLISTIAAQLPKHPDWQLFYFPPENLFVINLPPDRKTISQRQLAANLVVETCPWTAFSSLAAQSWVTYDNAPFFGTSDGRVYRGWTGWQDEVDLSNANGKDVKTQVQQAYSFLGAPAIQKQVGMYRPGFLVSEQITFGAVIEYDFLVRRLRIPSANSGREDYSVWADAANPRALDGIWDIAVWSGGVFPYRRWIQAAGLGTAASLRMSMASHSDILWVATDYSYKVGGLL